MIAFLYDNEPKTSASPVPGVDLFAFRDVGAPHTVIDSWTYEGGVYTPREKGTLCGTEAIILAEEEKLRRAHLGDLEHYLASWPTNLPL